MKLYHNPLSPNGRKPLAVIKHLGLECDEQILDFQKGEHKTPEYLALNPNGKVPTLVDGDFVLWESNAIAAYLASTVDTDMWPKTNARYDVMRWFNWEAQHWTPALTTYIGEHIFKKMRGGEPDADALAEADKKVDALGAVLDGHLKDRKYLLGDTLTLADFSVAAIQKYIEPAKMPLAKFDNIMRWNTDLLEIPAWRSTLG